MSQLNDLAAKARQAETKKEVEELYQRAIDTEDGPLSESLLALLVRLDQLWFRIHLASLRKRSDRI